LVCRTAAAQNLIGHAAV
jgi:hypothetical protein